MTEDEKIWFVDQLNKAIGSSEERMVVYIDKAIRASEERMVVYIDKAIQASEDRMVAYIDKAIRASEDRMTEQMRNIETTMLTEFQKWASPVEMRLKTHTATLRAVDAEIEYLSGRVKDIEDNQQKAS